MQLVCGIDKFVRMPQQHFHIFEIPETPKPFLQQLTPLGHIVACFGLKQYSLQF